MLNLQTQWHIYLYHILCYILGTIHFALCLSRRQWKVLRSESVFVFCDTRSCNFQMKLADIRKPQFEMQCLLTDFV